MTRPSGARKKPSVTPFRYSDLPNEIKAMCCREMFPSIRLELEDRNCSCAEYQEALLKSNLENPPGVLRANKALRAECMPLFSASLVPVTFDVFPNETLARVPAQYLENVTTMIVDEETAQIPDPALLPSLKQLIIHICWDYDATDKVLTADREATLDEILDAIMEAYSKTNVCYFIEEAKLKGQAELPYKVMIETQVDLVCDHLCEGLWLEDILVDVDARQIITHNNAHKIGHESDCPSNDKYNGSDVDENAEDDEGGDGWEDAEVEDGSESGEGQGMLPAGELPVEAS